MVQLLASMLLEASMTTMDCHSPTLTVSMNLPQFGVTSSTFSAMRAQSLKNHVCFFLFTTEIFLSKDIILSTGNVTVDSITMSSAAVSWIVPSVTEPQEYYIIYGTNQNDLSLVTDRIRGDTDTSLENVAYSISLQNLDPGTKYYLAVVAEFGSTVLFSNITSFTTIELGIANELMK